MRDKRTPKDVCGEAMLMLKDKKIEVKRRVGKQNEQTNLFQVARTNEVDFLA